MTATPCSPSGTRRGGGVLGLLIVVAIILFVVIYASPLAPDRNGVTQAQTQIDRTQALACDVNINNTYKQMMSLQMANGGGVQITPRILEKKGMLPRCPEGGEYVMKDNKLYCTKHSPPPPDETPAAAATTSTQASVAPASPAVQ